MIDLDALVKRAEERLKQRRLLEEAEEQPAPIPKPRGIVRDSQREGR